MDRNTLIGFLLILALVIGYSIYNSKQVQEKQDQETLRRDSIALVEKAQRQDSILHAREDSLSQSQQTAVVPTDSSIQDSTLLVAEKENQGIFYDAMQGTPEEIVLENEHLKVVVSTLGGTVTSAELKNFQTYRHEPLVLFEAGNNQLGFSFDSEDKKRRSTDSLFFHPLSDGFTVAGDDRDSLVLRLNLGEDQYLEYIYALSGTSNFVDYKVRFHNFDDIISSRASRMILSWQTKTNLLERFYEDEAGETTIYYRIWDDEVDDFPYKDDVKKENIDGNPDLQWLAHKQQFFFTGLIADKPMKASKFSLHTPTDSADYVKELSSSVILPYAGGADQSYNFKYYFGPLQYKRLAKHDLELEDMVPMGSSILGFINRNLIYPVFKLFSNFTSSAALIILLLAIFIKIILTPLTWRSYISQAKMRVIKPETEALREQYKDDMQKFQVEQMKLYRKAGVNVLGGCIPMLLQMPILFALYRFFPHLFELRQSSFLWIEDFSTYDSIAQLPFHVPFYGDHVSLLTILMAASSIIYAKMNSQMGSTAAGPMKNMQYIFPFFLIFIFNSFAAGLTYYYFLYNVLTFAQQWFFMNFVISEEKIKAKIEANKKKPRKGSRWEKWSKRLEDMQKEQVKKRQGGTPNPKNRRDRRKK